MPATTALALASKNLGLEIRDAKHLSTVKHSITRYRITLEAFHASLGGTSSTTPKILGACGARPSESIGVWKTPAQMRQLAFSAAHKKLATRTANRILFVR
jgi:hypothetical protein